MITIRVLIENHEGSAGLTAEHGLSLFLETGKTKILLDAGATNAVCENAGLLGVHLEEVDYAVLSHGHYDHSGGFDGFFAVNGKACVYANKKATGHYYSGNGGLHEIGIPEQVLSHRERFVFQEGDVKLSDGIYLISHHSEHPEKIGEKAKLYRKREEEIVPDDFAHEQSLVFSTDRGLVIFNSCSHGGVPNIVREVREALTAQGIDKPVYAYVGGLHMKAMRDGEEICTFSDEQLDELADFVRKEGISVIYTGHCTGDCALGKLQERLPGIVRAMHTGLVIELEAEMEDNVNMLCHS